MLRFLRAAAFSAVFLVPSFTVSARDTKLQKEQNAESLRRLINILDYVAADYAGAVKDGKIISAAEYTEMQEFSKSAIAEFEKIARKLPPGQDQSIRGNLKSVQALVENKSTVVAVQALTKQLRNDVIRVFEVSTVPAQTPDFKLAQTVYQANCSSCHGVTGHADTPVALKLDPPPRNFHDLEVMPLGSPFKFYNTEVLGVDGTSMQSYRDALSEHEIWSTAFYIGAIRHIESNKWQGRDPASIWADLAAAEQVALERGGLALGKLASDSDDDLVAWVASLKEFAGQDPAKIQRVLGVLRAAAPFRTETARVAAVVASTDETTIDTTPPASATDLEKLLGVSISKLDEAKAARLAKDNDRVSGLLLDAYLLGFDKVEKALMINHGPLVAKIEQQFIEVRQSAGKDADDVFLPKLADLRTAVVGCQSLIPTPSKKPGAFYQSADFISSLIIILREGFEAFLIVAAMLAAMQGIGAVRAKRWIHAGWISAIIAGFATFVVYVKIVSLQGFAQETQEAVSTLIAAAVLFYVGFWFLSQSERTRWDRFIKQNAKLAVSTGKLWILFLLVFVAVYREAAETVLFYHALMSSSSSVGAVWGGFAVGCACLFVLCWLIMVLGLRLPLRQFFLSTSIFMVLISLILVGKGMNELTKAGLLHPTNLPHFPRVDVLGIYPNAESLVAQVLLVIFALGVWVYSRRTVPPAQA